MGWLLTTVTFPLHLTASQFSLARKHGGEMVMQAVFHCFVSHCCVCVPGREWQWIARHRRGLQSGKGFIQDPYQEQGTDIVLFPFQ